MRGVRQPARLCAPQHRSPRRQPTGLRSGPRVPFRCLRWATALGLAALVAACGEATPWREVGPGPFLEADVDGGDGPPGGDVGRLSCTLDGTSGGCEGELPRCVPDGQRGTTCEAATEVGEGEPCTRGAPCGIGQLCVGGDREGRCRAVCVLAAPVCGEGARCDPHPGLAPYGAGLCVAD